MIANKLKSLNLSDMDGGSSLTTTHDILSDDQRATYAMSLVEKVRDLYQAFKDEDIFEHLLCKNGPPSIQVQEKDGKLYVSFFGTDIATNIQSLKNIEECFSRVVATCKDLKQYRTTPSTANVENVLKNSAPSPYCSSSQTATLHKKDYDSHTYERGIQEGVAFNSDDNVVDPTPVDNSESEVAASISGKGGLSRNDEYSALAEHNSNDNANYDGSLVTDNQGSPPHDSENHNIVTKGVVTKDVDSGNSSTSKSETGETILAESVNHHAKGIPEGIDFDNSHIEEPGNPHGFSGNEERSASFPTNNLDSSSSISVSDSEVCSSDSDSDVISEDNLSFEDFKKMVDQKWKALTNHYMCKRSTLECKAVVIYNNTDDENDFKILQCESLTEAYRKAFDSSDIRKGKFPVVLVITTDKSSAFEEPLQRKVKANSSKVGQIKSPTIRCTLHTAPGQKFSDIEFRIDTGADTGSVGYNYKIVKHSILTVCDINDNLEPGILGKVTSDVITRDEILVLDVDEDPNWNGIGLRTLRNYPIFMDVKNRKVVMGKHEDVTINTQEKTAVVEFKNENCYHEYQL